MGEGVNLAAIDHPDDPRIEAYRNIRERDLVGRRGRFVAEGGVVLGHLIGRGLGVDSVLLSAKRVEKLRPLLDRLAPGTPVYAAEQGVMDAVSGFPVHRGVLAIGRRPADLDPLQALRVLPSPALVVGLFGIANHDNMGAVFRNAAAFGAGLVMLDPTCCDPLYRKSIRVSVGAALTVPFARAESEAAALAAFEAAGFERIALSPSGARDLRNVKAGRRVALLVGAEGPGLSDRVLSSASAVRIAMAPGIDSLNVSVACGIALHELARSVALS